MYRVTEIDKYLLVHAIISSYQKYQIYNNIKNIKI